MDRRKFLKNLSMSLAFLVFPKNIILNNTADKSLEEKLLLPYKEIKEKFQIQNKKAIVIEGSNHKMYLIDGNQGFKIKSEYNVSTGKYGFGNKSGTGRTPTGIHIIKEKYHSTNWEMTSRIMVLDGCEEKNKNTYSRRIYIHGTPDEVFIGKSVSKGCIRMKNKDIIELYNLVDCGTYVNIKEFLI